MKPLYIAYGLIGCFFATESVVRQGKNAKSLQAGPTDRGSTQAVGTAFGISFLALLVAPLLNWRGIGRLSNEKAAWSGIVAMLTGLTIRIWANRVLGSSYTRTLRTEEHQQLIQKGPYKLIRNPGYLGNILLWLGAGATASNWIIAVVISLPTLGSYLYRIQAEEEMLASTFSQDYQNYASHTWKLIPFIY